MAVAYKRWRDVFHPACVLGPLLLYPYFISPLVLVSSGVVGRYLPIGSMPLVQGIYLVGILSLLLGTLRTQRGVQKPPSAFCSSHTAYYRAAVALGVIGWAGYIVSIQSDGGLQFVYQEAHEGEGLELSGYIRDLKWFLVPSILLVFLGSAGRRLRVRDLALITILVAPLILRAVVTGGRANAFAIIMAMALGLYLLRGARPRLPTAFIGAAATVLVVLTLVTHRDVLHLGDVSFQFKGFDTVLEFIGRETTGQEYVFGSGTILDAMRGGTYEWGGRILQGIVVRAIPSALWPSKYSDTERLLHLPNDPLSANVAMFDWAATEGASTGLIAGLWKQFWLLSFPVLYLIGVGLGRLWRRGVAGREMALLSYGIALCLALTLTQQTFQAWLWQLLFLIGGSWMAIWASVSMDFSSRDRRRGTARVAMRGADDLDG